jgi:hypothetical protein
MKGDRRLAKPVVLRSIEDQGGDRCVDILREGGRYFWVECRRDPEDSHGWRHVGVRSAGFGTDAEALAAARAAVGWMEDA